MGRNGDTAREPDPGSAISAFVDALDVEDLIMRFDVDFDVPMQQSRAIGMLRLAEAYEPGPQEDTRRTARRVGAHWCEIVRADVAYELLTGLRLIEASRPDAEYLHGQWERGELHTPDVFSRYVIARWFDGVGRIQYRLGSFTTARLSFETAVTVAETSNLWWVLPDLRSNHARARYEEQNQTARAGDGGTDAASFISSLEELRDAIARSGASHGVDTEGEPSPESPREHREFLRGYSNALHNLAVALGQSGDNRRSLEVTARSLAISEGLRDEYRIAQSITNQAIRDKGKSVEHFARLRDTRWHRGRLIARQNLAISTGGAEGLKELGRLLDELDQDVPGAGRRTGMDVDFHAYTVQGYRKVARTLPEEERPDDLLRRQLRMAKSVRAAIALPLYKRAYARHVRPAYLQAIADRVCSGDGSRENVEKVLSLVEESSGRELLDLLASSQPQPLGPPSRSLALAEPPRPAHDGEKRRGAPQPVTGQEEEALRELLAERERAYEDRFMHHPLTSATHDEDIAHRLAQYTLNHQGSCVIRYFRFAAPDGVKGTRGEAVPDSLGMVVCREGQLTMLPPVPYELVAGLARQVSSDLSDDSDPTPSEQTCRRVWDLLVAPAWEAVCRGGAPTHLTLIPTDDIFAIPLHVALAPDDGRPLAARVPLSQSVSVAAFVTHGRHLLKRQLVEANDDLAALLVTDTDATGGEMVGTGWPAEHIAVAGRVPEGLSGPVRLLPGDWDGIAELTACKPEFFVYAGHGRYVDTSEGYGPLLRLGDSDWVTQFDLALRLSLPRNKLAILGACLAGQGMRSEGGDVLGFMRSLIISGAGAVGVPLWEVLDSAMVATVRSLLRQSREAVGASGTGVFDVVEALHRHYRQVAGDYDDAAARIKRLPLALYL
ncbi:CHAT domain-containing protein [Streptomyces sp. NPDC005551]|uniref:CHAT domain-containing protein n=1 Tax=Streptomyces sp. NPDC005551 TaxID=3364725 RepID=UPI0036C3545D